MVRWTFVLQEAGADSGDAAVQLPSRRRPGQCLAGDRARDLGGEREQPRGAIVPPLSIRHTKAMRFAAGIGAIRKQPVGEKEAENRTTSGVLK
jgi:hypothetical protein